ncbi:MAG: type II secretion system protein [Phycisphaerae bacterium]|nr:type II secretion system protein [Phycisphaerae bacterium]
MNPMIAAHHAHARSRGFTLVELAASMAIMALLTGALASIVVLSTRAAATMRSEETVRGNLDACMTLIDLDARAATQVLRRGSLELDMLVPDRNGDGDPERIRYAWSGSPGAPLRRTYNTEDPYPVSPPLQSFALAFESISAPDAVTSPSTETAEMLLASNQATPNASFQLDQSNWCGHIITPTLPVGAIAWRVTRVQVQLRMSSARNGTTSIELRGVNSSGKPDPIVIDSSGLDEAAIGSTYAWFEAAFRGAGGLTPGSRIALTLNGEASSQRLEAGYVFAALGGSFTGMVRTSNSGGSWTAVLAGLAFRLYGTATLPGTTKTTTHEYLTAVRVTARPADKGTESRIAIPLMNAPEYAP